MCEKNKNEREKREEKRKRARESWAFLKCRKCPEDCGTRQEAEQQGNQPLSD